MEERWFDTDMLDKCIKYGLKISQRADGYRILYATYADVHDCITKGDVYFSDMKECGEYKRIIEHHMQKRISERQKQNSDEAKGKK